MSEQRQRFIEDFLLNYYSVTDLAERFSISRKTAHKWINRYLEQGPAGLEEQSRRPKNCPWQTDPGVAAEIVVLREKHPSWGPKKLLDVLGRRNPERSLPSIPTAARILDRAGLVKPRRRYRRAHPGCPQTKAAEPNDIWPADYKGQFRLKNGKYCFPLTVSDLSSRYILGVDAHPAISMEKTFAYFKELFETYGLPNRIRTDNRSSSLTGRGSLCLECVGKAVAAVGMVHTCTCSAGASVKLGIYPELIEPGKPQQNGVHERMHRTLIAQHPVREQEATIPPASSLLSQQQKFDEFREEFNQDRPHEAIGMKRPGELYRTSEQRMPKRIDTHDYPAHFLVRRVSRAGTIRMFRNQIFVSNTLREDYVGLEEVADGVYDLYFCFYQIGRYDLKRNKIQGIVSKVGLSVKRVGLVSRV